MGWPIFKTGQIAEYIAWVLTLYDHPNNSAFGGNTGRGIVN